MNSGFSSWLNNVMLCSQSYSSCSLHLYLSVSVWPFVFVFTLSFFSPALISPSTHCCVRSLVDILRHQSSPVQQGERNNTTVLTTTTSDGRMSKNLYTPILQSKDNRSKWGKPHEKTNHINYTHWSGWKTSNDAVIIRWNVWIKPTCHVPKDLDGICQCVCSQFNLTISNTHHT